MTISISVAIVIAVLFAVAAAVLVAVASMILARPPVERSEEVAGASFVALRSFYSQRERELALALEQALGPSFRIFGKVRLADMVVPDDGLPADVRRRVRARAERRRVDMVVCTAEDLAICGAIEVDDRSPEEHPRYIRSGFVEDVLASADIPLLRMEPEDAYELAELREYVFEQLGLEAFVSADVAAPVTALEAPPLCPQCQVPMARCRSVGERDSHEFWGCGNFPRCNYVVPVEG